MKVAIHNPDFSGSFAEKWIEYCLANRIEYFIVDCLDNEIISTLKKECVSHLLWHFSQNWKDLLTARNILFSAQMIGIRVFPDVNTCWHFDDKISQKYLLESFGIDIVKTFVFYDFTSSKKWLEDNSLPVVAKLRRGSGSTSVKLLKSRHEYLSYASRMFTRGLNPQSTITHDFRRRIAKISSLDDLKLVVSKLCLRVYNNILNIQIYPRELGYFYFQKYIPHCLFDIRIVVIGTKAFGLKRMVRKNDFRASGSGNIIYKSDQIPEICIRQGFSIASRLYTQCIAIDFVIDTQGVPYVTEISYGFTPRAYDQCEGYWDENLIFHKGETILEYCILEDLLNKN